MQRSSGSTAKSARSSYSSSAPEKSSPPSLGKITCESTAKESSAPVLVEWGRMGELRRLRKMDKRWTSMNDAARDSPANMGRDSDGKLVPLAWLRRRG